MRSTRLANGMVRGSWVTASTARLASLAISDKSCMTATPFSLSSAAVGSSASMTEGAPTRARATATRCCSPPESFAGKLFAFETYGIEPSGVAALAAVSLGISQRIADTASHGDLRETVITGSFGQVVTYPAGDRALLTRPCAALAEAVLYTTSPRLMNPQDRATFSAVEDKVRLSRYGGDCYAYCMLAAGHVDLVIETELKPHDVAALIPIISGAGGIITTWAGRRWPT